METTVAVIGAGNGGSAIAAYLSSLHVKVNLCDLFPEYIEGIQTAGGIDLIQDGACKHCTLNLVTSDVAQAIRGVRVCQTCGCANDAENAFCSNCGQPMGRD